MRACTLVVDAEVWRPPPPAVSARPIAGPAGRAGRAGATKKLTHFPLPSLAHSRVFFDKRLAAEVPADSLGDVSLEARERAARLLWRASRACGPLATARRALPSSCTRRVRD